MDGDGGRRMDMDRDEWSSMEIEGQRQTDKDRDRRSCAKTNRVGQRRTETDG